MKTYLSLLRGINVSGQRKVPMAQLKVCYEGLGFEAVETYIQSGNVVFRSPESDSARLEMLIQNGVARAFGFRVPVLVRSEGEWAAAVAANPLPGEPGIDPAFLHVTFLGAEPGSDGEAKLAAVPCGDERYRRVGREVFVYCPNGYGRAKLNNNLLENKLGVSASTRNWKTVNKLLEMARAAGG